MVLSVYEEGTYQLAEEVGQPSIRNITDERAEEKSPRHWVKQGFLDLIPLEMLVPNTLLVFLDTAHGKDTILLFEPARIKLIIGNDEEENHP